MASQEVQLGQVGGVQQHDIEAAPPGYYSAAPPAQQQQLQHPQQQPASSPNPAVPNPAHVNNAPSATQKGYYAGGAPYAGAPAGAKPMGAAFPVATPLNLLGGHPQPVDCPYCNVRTLTTVTQEPSTMTQYVAHISFVLIYFSSKRVLLFMKMCYVLTIPPPVSRLYYAASSAYAWSSSPTRPIWPATPSTAAVLAGGSWQLLATAAASML